MNKKYKISEISKLYGIGLDSIRYYEEIGLITPQRGENNYRYYDGDDICKLNIIRELIDLGFSTKNIQEYFKDRTIESTFELLKKEKEKIDERILELKRLKENVDARLKEIKDIKTLEFEKVHIKNFNKRKYTIINKGYKDDSGMNVLMRQLSNKSENDFYIIGNNQIGSVIPKDDYIKDDNLVYKAVFNFSKDGSEVLGEGTYLSILYLGNYNKTKMCIDKINEFVSENNLEIISDYLELIWIDEHSTDYENEYVTEVQVKVRKCMAGL